MTHLSLRARTAALAALAAFAACALGAAGASAQVPQTITVDGVNDFNAANLLDDDRGDTEIKDWCNNDPAVEGPMDLGRIYVTNDVNFIYIGFEYDRDCFNSPQVNLGMAIDVNGAFGGTTDPFNRKIGWANVVQKPDLVVYDVIDGFNFEALYQWQGASWVNIGSTINPGYGGGSNGLGIVENTGFVEYRLPLSALGSPGAGTPIRLEWWMTQDGTTKGPLDAVASDGVQMSRFASTTFDTTDVVQMTGYKTFTILNAVDNTPPTVVSAAGTGFTLLANKAFSPNTNKIDVTFSEPVDATTAQNVANYALTGTAVTVSSAVRDVSVPSVVHLTLSGNIAAQVAAFVVTVTNVKDLSNNTIVANGTSNVRGFFLQNVTFRGNTEVGFCRGVFAATDSFWVEGNATPLTFAGADNARMIDPDVDRVYTTTVPFSLPRDPGTGVGSLEVQWKLFRSNAPTAEFESGDNRLVTLVSTDGATKILDAFWSNDDPLDFTTKAMDVVFRLNASAFAPGGGDVITLLGSEGPLSFTQPGLLMNAAGGGIYTRTVRFPRCTRRDVRWKVDYNGVFECDGQGDRTFTLNEAVSDTVGGALGALVLPARGIDACTVSDKAVAVTFPISMRPFFYPSPSPLSLTEVVTFSQPDTAVTMLDDGVPPDAVATDRTYTATIVFPKGSDLAVTYKHRADGNLECFGANDRSFTIDDVGHSVGNPQVRPLARWNYCSDELVDAEDGATPGRLELAQNVPNPVAGGTTIAFALPRAGKVELSVYDVAGRRIARVLEGDLPAGGHRVAWNGRDDAGRPVAGGVYFYEVVQGSERSSKRMVVLAR